MKRLVFLLFCLSFLMTGLAQTYIIYPIPQQQMPIKGTAHISPKVCIVTESGIDEATVARARQVLEEQGYMPMLNAKAQSGQTNLLLGINGSQGTADMEVTRLGLSRHLFAKSLTKYDKHLLSLQADKRGIAQIVILGEHTDAVFCGLASLEQMLEQGLGGSFPCTTIYDYADIRDRGVIEGYYGVPYSAEVTKDLFRFMARYKMNTYMYGAKSDPYHSRYWADPYPTSITDEQRRIGYLTQDMLKDITAVAHATKVNFIWAIHPGTAFTDANNSEVLRQIMHKFESMHELGVRQFGVFVDDVGVPSDDATLRLGADRLTNLQKRIDTRWNRAGALATDTVKPLHYVPQLYAFSWVSAEQGQRFFSSLTSVPEKVRIYITGRNVWSVPNTEDLNIVHEWLGHVTSWWWNYPCNDNDMTKLFPADTYTNFRDEKHIQNNARMETILAQTPTLISNPMQQGEASKIALFSVADYAWNTKAFDNQRSWEAALPAVVGTVYAPALQTLIPYLRYYDKDALAYLADNYRHSVNAGRPFPYPLICELRRVLAACTKMEQAASSECESTRLFYEDISPWLFKLKAMCEETVARLEGKSVEPVDLNNNPTFQFPILNGLGADISLDTKTAEPAAEVLQPLLLWLRESE